MTGPPADPVEILRRIHDETECSWTRQQAAVGLQALALERASGGSGEAPAGLTQEELDAFEEAVDYWFDSAGDADIYVLLESSRAKLRGALRAPSSTGGREGRS